MPKLRRKIPLCPPVLIGDVGEYATLHFLRENGYEAQNVFNLIPDMRTASYNSHTEYVVLDHEAISRELLEQDKQRKKQFIKYYKSAVRRLNALFGKDNIVMFQNYLKDLGYDAVDYSSPQGSYTPDVVATKDGETYIIEVKANTGRIDTKEELEGLLRAKNYGLIPTLITLDVKIEATDCAIEILPNKSENTSVREALEEEGAKQAWSFPRNVRYGIPYHVARHFLRESGYKLGAEVYENIWYLVQQRDFFKCFPKYWKSTAKKLDARTDKDKISKYTKYIKELIAKKWNEETSCEPDFSAEKDGHVYVVGIDSSLMRITKEKMEWLLRAKDYGFSPILVKPKVNIEVSKFAMETLC